MCGIVGYIGDKEAASFLLERLDDLSYRGYDSAGISVMNDGSLIIAKEPGKIQFLRDAVNSTRIPGTIGIGHTRWATHGVPNKVNAHPHTDCSGKISLVQNGIIENYLTLKRELIERGHEFKSETDTEVIVHLIEEEYNKGADILEATRKAVELLEGSFAIAVMATGEERLIAARHNAPLIVGVGGGENYIASDITALLQDTNKIYVLENGDIVSVEPSKVSVSRFGDNGDGAKGRLTIVDWKAEDVSKGNFENYMLKEIYEQPQVVENTLAGRIKPDGEISLRSSELSDEIIRKMENIHIIACGTAYHAGCFGKYLFEKLFRIPVSVDVASEFRYREPIIGPDTLVLLISQSGETADTLASLIEAKRQGAMTMGIVNVRGSSIAREADCVLYTKAGPEIAVASTKAFTAQLIALFILGLKLAQEREIELPYPKSEIIEALQQMPQLVEETIERTEPGIKEMANIISRFEHCYFLGRNMDEPIAREGALKLKEISYVHAEAYPAGELKHGTIALIEKGTPVIPVMTQEDTFEKMVSNIQEVIAREAQILAITREGLNGMEGIADMNIEVPDAPDILAPLLANIPLQLLAYYTAEELGRDIDQPRNLAKSVTVE